MQTHTNRPGGRTGVSTLAVIVLTAAAVLVTAQVAVVIHYHRAARLRESLQPKMVTYLKYAREMIAGEAIYRCDITTVSVPKRALDPIRGGAVFGGRIGDLLGRRLRQSVEAGQWVQWNHVSGVSYPRPSPGCFIDLVGITLCPDRQTSFCAVTPGDWVNVVGLVDTGDGCPRAYRVLRNAEIIAIGGTSLLGEYAVRNPPDLVGLEVTAEISHQLSSIRGFMKGNFWLELLPPGGPGDPNKVSLFSEDPIIRQLLKRAAASEVAPDNATRPAASPTTQP